MSGPYRIFQNYKRYNVNSLMFGSWRDTIGLDVSTRHILERLIQIRLNKVTYAGLYVVTFLD